MRRSLISLGAGIVLAVIAVMVMRMYVGAATHSSSSEPDSAFTQIAVTAVDLPSGEKLYPRQIQFVRWPKASVPVGAFQSLDEIFKGSEPQGYRVVLVSLVRGEPVLRTKVSGMGSRPIFSSMVRSGMRAISIKIDDVSGVSGFILPGDYVDIMLTRRVGQGYPSDYVTDLLLQGVKVLGIDQLAGEGHDKPVVGHTATVEVTPEQAGKLALAQQAGTLSLALRNPDTTGGSDVGHIGEKDLTRRGAGNSRPDVVVHYGITDSSQRSSEDR